MDEVRRIADALEEGNRRLQAFGKADAAALDRPYAPGKWTGVQILAHVADGDMVCYTRLHQAIVEPGDTLFPVPMDGVLWMEKLQCDKRPVAVSLAASYGARIGMIHTLRNLPSDVLLRTLKHDEMGTVSPLRYAEISAEHALHHLAQLDSLVSGGAPEAAR
ncbi:MAG: DinB family protein [Candidatus Hydrogenedentes bacterium]|nr:DinB family protein [Candidatus Hydrogenedentota bacterium]